MTLRAADKKDEHGGERRAKARAYRRANRDRYREYAKAYYQRNKERLKAEVTARRRAEPEKARARMAIANALRRGHIERPSRCAVDDCPYLDSRLEAHHDDYGKPLEVQWLCAVHHAERDR